MTKIIQVYDHAKFGALLLGWARNPATRPRTVGDFSANVDRKVAEIIGYSNETAIDYPQLQPSADAPTIAVPALKDLETPVPAGTYPIPDFYKDLAYHTEPNVTDRDTFRLCRIAEYCTNKCM